jgi:hypothetical protein
MRMALPLLVLLAGCSAPPEISAAREAELAARSARLADQFQTELQQALKAALAAGGPVGAIDTCATVAPAIADRLSAESGATVRRTALMARNPAAKPDAFERETMTAWRAEPLDEAGRPRVRVAAVTGQAGPEVRWIRAIPTQKMCLQCHGEALAPEVTQALAARYPDDRATGFREGQLRGALSIRWAGATVSGK